MRIAILRLMIINIITTIEANNNDYEYDYLYSYDVYTQLITSISKAPKGNRIGATGSKNTRA